MIINHDGGRKYTSVNNNNTDSVYRDWYEDTQPDLGGIKHSKASGPGMNEAAAFDIPGKRTQPESVPANRKTSEYIPDIAFNDTRTLDMSELSEHQTKEVGLHIPKSPALPKAPLKESKVEAMTKYEYLYGLKDIDIGYEQYEDKAIYVSEPITADGNVVEITLDSREEHPLFDDISGQAASRQTSIEYYIASVGNNPNPALEDWVPILPENQSTILSERLMFASVQTAGLRFPARIGEGASVYCNGIKMTSDEWAFIDGGYAVQIMRPRLQSAVYTIDYTPNEAFVNPRRIDASEFNVEVRTKTERFKEGTDHQQTIQLEEYPYIDHEIVNNTEGYDPNGTGYVPIEVSLKKAGIVGVGKTMFRNVEPMSGGQQQVYTRNMTDYKEGIERPLKKYSIDRDNPYNVFEYRQNGKKILFSETFNRADIYDNQQYAHGNAEIEVKYQYISRAFRVKVIMRRNSPDGETLAPALHNYQLKFKVMK